MTQGPTLDARGAIHADFYNFEASGEQVFSVQGRVYVFCGGTRLNAAVTPRTLTTIPQKLKLEARCIALLKAEGNACR